MTGRLGWTVALCLLGPAGAEPVDPSFQADFEDLPAAQSTEGLAGQAFLGGGQVPAPGLTFPTRDVLSLKHGTVAMWVKPVDWSGDDRYYHSFFGLRIGQGGYLILYKNYSPATGVMFGWDPDEGPGKRFNRSLAVTSWQPGQWHHVAGTWSDGDHFALYVDGQRVGIGRGITLPPDDRLPATFTIGSAQVDHPGQTAIDELRIFRRALSAREVLALFAAHAPADQVAAARAALPPAGDIPSVRIAHSSLDHLLLVAFRADCLGSSPPVASAELGVADPAGKPVGRETVTPRANGGAEFRLATGGWPLGRYEARLTFRDAGGRELGATAKPFQVATTETWATAARLGLSPAVPPPYQPVQANGATVGTLTARITIGGSGLPVSVVAGGREILAGPVGLECGQAIRPSAEPIAGAVDAAAARLTGAMTAGAEAITISARVEYDNLCWFEVTVPPALAARVDSLHLTVPLRREVARYLNAALQIPTPERPKGYLVLPRERSELWSLDQFCPAVWVGDDARGLGWFAESDQFWSRQDGHRFELTGDGEVARLRIRLLSAPVAGTTPLVYRFGLQPTPVRALAPGWRAERWLPSSQVSRYLLTLRGKTDATGVPAEPPDGRIAYHYAYNDFCNTLPDDPAVFQRQIEVGERFGLFIVPYSDILDATEGSGEHWLHAEEMDLQPGARFGPSPTAGICTVPSGKAADLYVWWAHHLASTYRLNGLYIDEAWVYPGTGPAQAGLGYPDADGTRRPTWPLLARREMLRRVRNVFAAQGRPFRIVLHLSSARVPPLVSMGDQLLLGEEFYLHVTRDPIYAHSVTPERLQAAYLPGSMGIPVVFLPQFKASGQRMKDVPLARGLLAVTLLHDQLHWPVFAAEAPFLEVRRVLAESGVDGPETEFIGYYADSPPARSAPDGVLVSAWRTVVAGRRQALAIAANVGDTDRPAARIEFNPAALGLRQPKATVAGGDLAVTDGAVTVELPAHDFALIRLSE